MKRLFFCLLVFAACARTTKEAPPETPVVVSEEKSATATVKLRAAPVKSQAKKVSADKKPARNVLLGDAEEIETLGSFKVLVEKFEASPDYEKLKIEYLLERLSRTSYNLVRNGDAHSGKAGAAHLRYKWVKYRKEAATARDFVVNIASGSRISGDPYYVKVANLYYPAGDVLLFELQELDRVMSSFKDRRINEGEHLETVSQI